MTAILPPLKWVPSPNFSTRTAPVDLIVWHDCEGSYAGSISWFANPASEVSAHYVLNEDGTEATQMVALDKKAWHAKAFNSRSIGLEMGGLVKRGFPPSQIAAAAGIIAFQLHRYNLPARWAAKGEGPGFCRHYDLGVAGGHHFDWTTDDATWQKAVAQVQAAYAKPQPASWDSTAAPPHPATVGGIAWAQLTINKLGYQPALTVDGDLGQKTKTAIAWFQAKRSIFVSGKLDFQTVDALASASPGPIALGGDPVTVGVTATHGSLRNQVGPFR